MITKNKSKIVIYIDRESIAKDIVATIFAKAQDEFIEYVQSKIDKLQEKDAGHYFTLDLILQAMNKEIENMRAFYKGAVVPYYCRQMKDYWGDTIPASLLNECDEEIKTHVGYVIYDSLGNTTGETNSITNFYETKEFTNFLNDVENVCFKDSELLFPDSQHYKELEKTKGRTVASWQAFQELKQWHKNQFNQNV